MPELVAEPEEKRDQRELGSMSLLQHLEELRRRIIYSLIAVGVCTGAAWWWVRDIYAVIAKPVAAVLRKKKREPPPSPPNPTHPLPFFHQAGLLAARLICSPLRVFPC